MDKPMKKVMFDGITCYSVADAAKYLETTKIKILEMVANGTLECKIRENGKSFIQGKSLVDKKYSVDKT